ncbi:MAG: preprotein translocase subunit SecE [Firmicutes bacterium]|nr:preprotein translocase subunit SecE [Bacillota bacterium]
MVDKNEKKHKKEKPEKRRFRRVRETWSELKKVTWPSFSTVVKSLGVVLLIMAIFIAVLLVFDIILRVFGFNPLIGKGITWSSALEPLRPIFCAVNSFFSRGV